MKKRQKAAARLRAENPVIMPTGTCFDDALDYISERLQESRRRAMGLVLVHAICLAPEGPHKGEPFAHAWVEDGAEAWQGGLLNGERVFYAMSTVDLAFHLRPQSVTRYSLEQAWAENDRSGHYGPWVPEYEALCGGGGRVFAPEAGGAS